MKNINLLLASVLMCTLVSARGTDKPISEASSVAITNAKGSTLFKLYYKSLKPGRVQISITDKNGVTVFMESLKRVDGFIRPYNFKNLPKGQYTVLIEDDSGRTVEKVEYQSDKENEALIHVQRLASKENKFLLTIASPNEENVSITIHDEGGVLIHSETQLISSAFAQVYDLKNIKSFTIEVANRTGVLKSFSY